MLVATALWCAGAAVAWLWTGQAQLAWWRLVLAWAAVSAAACVAAWSGWRPREGLLTWDGAGWSWCERGAAAAAGTVRPSLDLQHVILVRWHDGGRGRWLWLERRRCGARWDDVRRAVYSRARPEAPPAAEPPAAKS